MRATYNPNIFNQLNEFSIAREQLEKRQDHLLELGDVICAYNLHQDVGVSLLHKHFNLDPQERLVEDFVDNQFLIQPQIEADCPDVAAYLWKVEATQKSGTWNYFPLEFSRVNHDTRQIKDAAESVTSNHKFLAEMATKLSELGLADIFGIAIIHRDLIKLAEGEIIVETTDDAARTLTCSATVQASIDLDKLTQTLWTFEPNEPVKGATACYIHNNCRHCVRHCLHCINH